MRVVLVVFLALADGCGSDDTQAPGQDLAVVGGGVCTFRDTGITCHAFCKPPGCHGTESLGDQETRDYVCVDYCDQCKPAQRGYLHRGVAVGLRPQARS